MKDIVILFVKEDNPSQYMLEAFQTCREILETTTWIYENEIDPKNLTKTEYLIFENFKNYDLTKFSASKCPILGPLAISTCLLESKCVPNYPWPIFNVAMYNCIVSFSNLTKSERNVLKEKVHYMGGYVTEQCTTKNTHLVTNSTKTVKYDFAVENGIQILSVDWIEKIWEASQTVHVDATRPDILEKYKLPCFYKLIICTTGITDNQLKKTLAKIIAENGGEMVNKLKLCSTDILICHGIAGTTSEKYKAACKVNTISCVKIDWIYDSINKGVALPHQKYEVIKEKTSTPKKEGENFDPNFSTISMIGGPNNTRRSEIDATVNATRTGVVCNSIKRKASDDLIDKLDLKKVKTAGQFLDGCSIYLAGFNPENHEKINKIINISGATRYNEISDRVTHVIVGDKLCTEIANIRNMQLPCALVSLQWLLDSISNQEAAAEDGYLLGVNDFSQPDGGMGSPLSQKAVSLLRTNSLRTESDMDKTAVPKSNFEPDGILKQYSEVKTKDVDRQTEDTLEALLNENPNPTFNNVFESRAPEEFKIHSRTLVRELPKEGNDSFEGNFKPNETSTQLLAAKNPEISTQVSEVSSEMPSANVNNAFNNLKLIVTDFDEEETQILHEIIENMGGQIVNKNFKGIADYAVLPAFGNVKLTQTAKEVVNQWWISDCHDEIMNFDNICYYHRPLPVPEKRPLKNCVITTSIYAGTERVFLNNLVQVLGAAGQEQFSRRQIDRKGVMASTHLVSPEPTGKKYEAAIKWNLPVVTKDWLIECARTGIKVPEKDFLVKGSIIQEDLHNSSSTSTESNKNLNSNMCVREDNQIDIASINTPEPRLSNDQAVATPLKAVKAQLSNAILKKTSECRTPTNQMFNIIAQDTPETYSQITPVNKILQDAIDNNLIQRNIDTNTPKGYYPWDPKTPETPLGLFITPNPSRSLRKEMHSYLNIIPDFEPPKRRLSTPLSELRRKLMDKVCGRGEFAESLQGTEDAENSDHNNGTYKELGECCEKSNGNETLEKNKESEGLDTKLQKFQEMLKASGSGSGVRKSMNFESTTSLLGVVEAKNDIQSQICTVGWDYGELETKEKVFMLSGLEAGLRIKIVKQLEALGAKVLDSSTYEESCTHLLCPKPSRNEKSLACMAGGKWILHLSYVEKSVQAGKFLEEQLYEFGNPKSKNIIQWDPKETINGSIYHWRLQMHEKGTGAFNNIRAIVVAGDGREKLVRVIEAGGGVIVNVKPPYHDTINATHCLLELKMVNDYKVYIPLAKQGIKCLNTIYIDHYLRRTQFEIKELCPPELAKYYS